MPPLDWTTSLVVFAPTVLVLGFAIWALRALLGGRRALHEQVREYLGSEAGTEYLDKAFRKYAQGEENRAWLETKMQMFAGSEAFRKAVDARVGDTLDLHLTALKRDVELLLKDSAREISASVSEALRPITAELRELDKRVWEVSRKAAEPAAE